MLSSDLRPSGGGTAFSLDLPTCFEYTSLVNKQFSECRACTINRCCNNSYGPLCPQTPLKRSAQVKPSLSWYCQASLPCIFLDILLMFFFTHPQKQSTSSECFKSLPSTCWRWSYFRRKEKKRVEAKNVGLSEIKHLNLFLHWVIKGEKVQYFNTAAG